MSGIYARWDLMTQDDGRVLVRYETNDDNDDGQPDGQVTVGTYGPMPMDRAEKMVQPPSHMGFYGQPVRIYLDGALVTEWPTP